MTARTGYFPGCSLEGTAREYNASFLAVARALGAVPAEVEDWNCCGATAAHSLDRRLSLALPARILALAGRQGFDSLVAPCAACSHRLLHAAAELGHDAGLRAGIERDLGMPVPPALRVVNALEFLQERAEAVSAAVSRKLAGLKVASYYGCLLVRPPKVAKFDDPEDPRSMDKLVALTGATPVEWSHKTECCGGGFSISRRDMVVRMTHDVLDSAAAEGADAIVVACPMCQSNLDMRQSLVNSEYGKSFSLPVLYITQLVGLAMGLPERDLELDSHFVSPRAALARAVAPSGKAA